MTDVVGVGANSVDFVYRLPAHPQPDTPQAKLPILDHRVSFGGQAATTVATCSALGLRAAYVGTFGSDDNGRRIRDELARRGVDVTHAVVKPGTNPFAVILLDDATGERVVLWRREDGVSLRAADLEPGVIGAARLVHVDDVDLEASIAAARAARERGLPVTSDIERADDGVRALVEAVTVPIFAEHVPAALSGEDRLDRALESLRRPHHSMLCVTRGARGAVLLDRRGQYSEPAMRVRTVDTTGAGDVFRGAFIYALLHGREPCDILCFANAAAAASCTRAGAMNSVPTRQDVDRLVAAAGEDERHD